MLSRTGMVIIRGVPMLTGTDQEGGEHGMCDNGARSTTTVV